RRNPRALVRPGGICSTPGADTAGRRRPAPAPLSSGGPGVSRNSHPVPLGRTRRAVPTSPEPVNLPPDTEAGPRKPRVDYTVLGQLETLAITRVTLTIPSTA